MRRFLILFLLALGAAAPAFAVYYQWSINNGANWQNSPTESCQEMATYRNTVEPGPSAAWTHAVDYATDNHCEIKLLSKTDGSVVGHSGYALIKRQQDGEPPGGGSGSCSGNAGVQSVLNWTIGYARTPKGDIIGTPNVLPPSRVVCSGGCKSTIDNGFRAWGSDVPNAQGTYRYSLDVNAVTTGESCTQEDAALKPDDAMIPPCVGSLGQVNGKPYCAGTAANPVSNDKPAELPVPPSSGNPAAGPMPSSGPGSGSDGPGRTPSDGAGGPAGGPALAAGNGTNGNGGGNTGTVTNGTVTKPGDGKEQANCGAPGQPQCKIDETGTPTDASGKLKAGTDQMNAGIDGHKKLIDDLKENTGPSWSLTFELPSSCTPFELWEGMSVDMCKYQPVIHDLMSMIWIATTLWACIAMMGRTFNSGT